MSTAAPKTDVERTATMLDLVHRIYGSGRKDLPPSHVVIEEVAPATGGGTRYADVLALSVWRSSGFALHGYEIKASRADLKRELADPGKHLAMARYCERWSLVIWSETMIVSGIPETWGIICVDEHDGEHELRTIRKPAKLKPDPWPASFVCSMVRNAYQQSPGAAYVARSVVDAYREGMRFERGLNRMELDHLIKPLAIALYGDKWEWPTEDPAEIIAKAITLLPSRNERVATTVGKIMAEDRK